MKKSLGGTLVQRSGWCSVQFPLQIVTQLNIYDVNGNLVVQIGPNAGIFVYDTFTPGRLTSSMAADDGTDSFGNSYYRGVYSYGLTIDIGLNSGGVLFSAHSTLPQFALNGIVEVSYPSPVVSGVPTIEVRAPEVAAAPSGRGSLILSGWSQDGLTNPTVTIGNQSGTFLDAQIIVRGTIVQEQGDDFTPIRMNWTALPLAVGWTSGAVSPQCYVDAMGFCHLEGAPFRGAGTPPAGEVLGTLDVAFRPRRVILTGIVFDSSATPGRIVIRTNGNIEIYDAPNNLPVLDGVTFSTAQTV